MLMTKKTTLPQNSLAPYNKLRGIRGMGVMFNGSLGRVETK